MSFTGNAMRAATLGLSLMVASCAAVPYYTCKTYNEIMPVLTAANEANKLSLSQRKGITTVRQNIGAGICEQGSPPDAEATARALVHGGVTTLLAIKKEAGL